LLLLRLLSDLWLLLFAGLLRLLWMLLRWSRLGGLRGMLLRWSRLLRFCGLRFGGFGFRLGFLFTAFALVLRECRHYRTAKQENGGGAGYSNEFHNASLRITILCTHLDSHARDHDAGPVRATAGLSGRP